MGRKLRDWLSLASDSFGILAGVVVLVGALVALVSILANVRQPSIWLIVLGAILLAVDIIVRLRLGRPPAAIPGQPLAVPQPIPSVRETIAPVSAASSLPAPEQRIFVGRTPEELIANFQNVTRVQGEGRVAPYIGKWLRIPGAVGNVSRLSDDCVLATFAGRTIFTYNVVNMLFRDKQWIDRMVLKSTGDEVTVVGRITCVDVQNIDLDDCELELGVISSGGVGVE